MKTKPKPRPSNRSQRINKDAWFYEKRGSITLIHWTSGGAGTRCATLTIPWRLLMESAKRCRPEQVKKTT